MGSEGTMGSEAIMDLEGTMGSEAIMGLAAPVWSSGCRHTGDRIGGPPMSTPRQSSRPPRRSMSNRRHRTLSHHRIIGIIEITHRATTHMSSSALVAGDQSRRPHHKRQPSARPEKE